MSSCGLIPGMISCALSGGIAGFGLYLLSRCATEAPKRRSSFFAVAKLTYPSLAIFFDAAIAIKCFGVSIRYTSFTSPEQKPPAHIHRSYLIIIKDLMPSVVQTLHQVTGSDSPLPWYLTSGRFWITAFMVVLVPLCFLRKLDSLRHTSYVALFSVGASKRKLYI
jgi:amino acid permease